MDRAHKAFVKKVGSLVRAERTKKKLSQHALAAKVGGARTTINSIESGRQCPSLRAFARLVHALGVPAQKLLPAA